MFPWKFTSVSPAHVVFGRYCDFRLGSCLVLDSVRPIFRSDRCALHLSSPAHGAVQPASSIVQSFSFLTVLASLFLHVSTGARPSRNRNPPRLRPPRPAPHPRRGLAGASGRPPSPTGSPPTRLLPRPRPLPTRRPRRPRPRKGETLVANLSKQS